AGDRRGSDPVLCDLIARDARHQLHPRPISTAHGGNNDLVVVGGADHSMLSACNALVPHGVLLFVVGSAVDVMSGSGALRSSIPRCDRVPPIRMYRFHAACLLVRPVTSAMSAHVHPCVVTR